jgi:uracil-DNA glycosylase
MRYVKGEGPTPCDLMFIGERPGIEEEKSGRPFVGKSGRELDRYTLHHLHRGRGSVYVTNLVKTWAAGDADPTRGEIERDRKALEDEFALVSPVFVATLGRHSTRSLLGDVDMEVVHGIPHIVDDYCVMPIYHPAAGLHSTEFQGLIDWDFAQLKLLMDGKIEPQAIEDEYPETKYSEIGPREVLDVPGGGVDTEGSITKPWCLTFSHEGGHAYCSRKPAGMVIHHAVLHNSMHDLGVLRALGVEVRKFDDTMVMAYLLGIEPQGLKALAKRHAGMDMKSYDDLVEPFRIFKQTEYLLKVEEWLNNRSSSESGRRPKRSSGRTRTRRTAGKASSKTASRTK